MAKGGSYVGHGLVGPFHCILRFARFCRNKESDPNCATLYFGPLPLSIISESSRVNLLVHWLVGGCSWWESDYRQHLWRDYEFDKQNRSRNLGLMSKREMTRSPSWPYYLPCKRIINLWLSWIWRQHKHLNSSSVYLELVTITYSTEYRSLPRLQWRRKRCTTRNPYVLEWVIISDSKNF